MSSRTYGALSGLLAIAGAFVVVTTFAFGHGAANAIDLGVIIGVTVVSLGAVAAARASQRVLSLGSVVIGVWTILVTAGIFSGAAQRWLTFAAGAAVALLGVAGHAAYDAARDRASSGSEAQLHPLGARQAA